MTIAMLLQNTVQAFAGRRQVITERAGTKVRSDREATRRRLGGSSASFRDLRAFVAKSRTLSA